MEIENNINYVLGGLKVICDRPPFSWGNFSAQPNDLYIALENKTKPICYKFY